MTDSSYLLRSSDPQMQKVWQIAENVASSRATILILGESGTGKEVLAKFVHAKSARAGKRLVALNCAAVPENLLESELFGHERGAFTGAIACKAGKFEVANGSSLLLDEMSEMPLHLQSKLLRVIQEGEIERVGGNQVIKVDVRLIATSNRDLFQMVGDGKFRQDLYYRLNVIPLRIPPLRQRPQDIRLLALEFVRRAAKKNGVCEKRITDQSWELLLAWKWPGNVRELENVIERAVILSAGVEIGIEDLSGIQCETLNQSDVRAGMKIDDMERQLIEKTLEFTNQNRTQAAEMLGISVRTLRNKINEYRMERGNE